MQGHGMGWGNGSLLGGWGPRGNSIHVIALVTEMESRYRMATESTKQRMSRAEYAAHRGVTVPAVRKAIISERIARAVGPDGKINVALADALWNTNTSKIKGGDWSGKPETKDTTLETLKAKAVELGVDGEKTPDYNESRAWREAYNAKLAELEYNEKTGKLVDQEAVKTEAFKIARLTRDAMLAIPDRLSAEIAGLTDPFVIHAKLTAEIRNAITEVAKVAE